jgi:hypothetical protein
MTGALRERWYIVAAALLLVVAGVAFLVLRSDDKPKATASKTLPVTPQLDTGGVALASLLSKGRAQTYHATYTSTAQAKVSGGVIGLEVWNTKGKSRVDTSLTTPDNKVVRTASILRGKKAVVCQQPSGGSWSCENAPRPATGDPAGLIASLQSQLSGRSVVESAGKVGQRDARCFQVSASSAGAEEIQACVDSRGVLLKLSSSEARIEIAKLDASAPDSAFNPPAAVKS